MLHQDNKHLASGSAGGTIRIWDVTTGQALYTTDGYSLVRSFFEPRTSPSLSIGWSADSRNLAIGDRNGWISILSCGQ